MRTQLYKIAFPALFALAMTLAFSCSDDGGGDDSQPSSSNSGDLSQGSKTDNNISDYKTVKIGNQMWMAENLNYYVEGSKCYNNNSDNCEKYGRLYDWETAKTVCPSGWHLPTKDEWDALNNYVGFIGSNLKEKDKFAALLGGFGYSDGYFSKIGSYGNWWSATDSDNNAYYLRISQNDDYGEWNNFNKKSFLSVRCLKENIPSEGSKTDNNISDYKTVEIGDHEWMAENLNYYVAGSKCYDNDPDNCETYGRLYNWETALTVCPSGWHLPTQEEWSTLINVSVTEFEALPGGYGYSDNSYSYGYSTTIEYFEGIGYYGYWWSATGNGYNNCWNMDNHTNLSSCYRDKSQFLSVRCMKDYIPISSSSSSEESSSSSYSSSSVESNSSSGSSSSSALPSDGSYTVNKISDYETVEIGEQVWMAENLNYYVEGSRCYDDDPDNCEIYGRLYDWATAMGFDASCNSSTCSSQINTKHQGICPNGWHIPSDGEWNTLIISVGGISTAAKHLKSKEGWSNCGPSGSGKLYSCEDTYEFAALPGGYGSSGGYFHNVGYYGRWWSATEYNADDAYYRSMDYYYEDAGRNDDYKTFLRSVRCVQD